jgi:glutamyl-tRNA reductase
MVDTLVNGLTSSRALVVGAGAVARTVALQLRSRGVGRVVVANRSRAPAVAIAGEVGGEAIELSALPHELRRADFAVCATASPWPVISQRMLEEVSGHRSSPLVLLDLAVPRDVEPRARGLRKLVLRDIDEIHQVAAEHLDERRRELPRAWAIVRSEAERFQAWRASLEAEPVIAELRRRAEEIRAYEVRRANAGSSTCGDTELAWLDGITRSLVNRLLHEPTARIRGAAATSSGRAQIGAVRELLALREDEAAPSAASLSLLGLAAE